MAELMNQLKSLRLSIAKEENKEAYQVFNNSSLEDMCEQRPSDEKGFFNIKGVGPVKRDKYAERFLSVINKDLDIKPKPIPKEIQLNEEQEECYKKATQTNNNVFLTGSPGTGKSYTLKKIISSFIGSNRKIGVTSTTGCSAILIGARTIHSYLKLGISDKTPEQLHYNVKKYPMVLKTLEELETLVIEEISMLSDDKFDTISKYLSLVRNNKEPFGGLQMVMVGDFCQLPPVVGDFCFKSEEWKRLNPDIMNLTTLVRQEGDLVFQNILERARFGNITDDDVAFLRVCKRQKGKLYTSLRATNAQANAINTKELNKLLSQKVEVKTYVNTLEKKKITLCVGCKVMVNWNVSLEEQIVNGTTGMVTKINKESVEIRLTNDDRKVSIEFVNITDEITQKVMGRILPLQLSWATTIHKSQGSTIDLLEVDLGLSIFAEGQAYVAMSRARDLKSLALLNIEKGSFRVNQDVKEFYQ
jgi:ATP-dependent DNA helicase PIF1